MRKIILCVVILLAVGCRQQAESPQQVLQPQQTNRVELLQSYKTEVELLDRIVLEKEKLANKIQGTIDEIQERVDRAIADETTDEVQIEFSNRLIKDGSENINQIKSSLKLELEKFDQQIAAQQVRVDRAKVELDAAEAKRD